MRTGDSWSQDVVLKAMCDQIACERREGIVADFILATGDLAFSGNSDEYKLIGSFLDAISNASGVPKERIYCVLGNHDIDRERQKMCFIGMRHFIQSQNQIDLLLSPTDDMETLLKRQEHYRNFHGSYFMDQYKMWASDGLGYVSSFAIDDVRFAVIGMDSAWLSEGGSADHGKLLIGERQAINTLNLATTFDPHIIIGIAHHPFHLLQDYDRRPLQNRIEAVCHFFHCGHLHAPEARNIGYSGSGCLTLAAGACFETRQSKNSYSFVTTDLLRAQRTVKIVQYDSVNGVFSFTSSKEYPIEITPSGTCSMGELASAMRDYSPRLSWVAHYFSALLLDGKTEIPIPTQQGYTFGSFAALQTQPASELRDKSINFMAFKNVLRVFCGRIHLSDLFRQHGDMVEQYGAVLEEKCSTNPELKARITGQERDAQILASTEQQTGLSYTSALFDELAALQDWGLLRAQAERHLNSPDQSSAAKAKRMLALSLAHSEETSDKVAAMEIYRALDQEGLAESSDIKVLSALLVASGQFEEAKSAVCDGIRKFPADASGTFFEIGLSIVEATGDRELRKKLQETLAKRGKVD